MTMKFTGGKELEAALRELGDVGAMRRTAERALKLAAVPIRDRAKELAPDAPESGPGKYLKDAIKIGKRGELSVRNKQFRGSAAGRSTVEVYIGIDGSVKPPQEPKTDKRRKRTGGGTSGGGVAFYSMVQEFGLAGRVAQPYMRPAFEQKKNEAVTVAADALRDEITRTAARQARKRQKG